MQSQAPEIFSGNFDEGTNSPESSHQLELLVSEFASGLVRLRSNINRLESQTHRISGINIGKPEKEPGVAEPDGSTNKLRLQTTLFQQELDRLEAVCDWLQTL